MTLMVNLFVVYLISLFTMVKCQSTYPTCGDCYCSTNNNGTSTCPTPTPQTAFSDSVVTLFKLKSALWTYSLNCNPYQDLSCKTTPQQTALDDSDAVCAYLYSGNCPNNNYEMVTYASHAAAVAAGAFVTHVGSCGLCSTAQDLAIYLQTDFTTGGKICATKGLLDVAAGQKCYESLGLTTECARIWNYDGIYDGQTCLKSCISHLTDTNNGPAPECALNPCLQCDEDKAGPIFSAFAARTRRRSGLLSEIIRPCDTIATGVVHDPQC